MLVASATLCLALNVYHEARGELIPGQYAVALVTLNRAGGNPNEVCNQTFKPRQFSWANYGVARTATGWQIGAHLIPRVVKSWTLAKKIAQTTLAGRMSDFTWGSTFYHAKYVKPRWTQGAIPVKHIGSHTFYALNYKS